MTYIFLASSEAPPIAGLLTASFVSSVVPINIQWGSETLLKVANEDGIPFNNCNSISRYLARIAPAQQLYGSEDMGELEVDHWLSYTIGPMKCNQEFRETVIYLNEVLASRTYFVENKLTIADFAVFGALFNSHQWKTLADTESHITINITRWFNLIKSLDEVKKVIASLPKVVATKSAVEPVAAGGGRKEEGKFVELPGAEIGKVVVRFPPEASGYLHIGHAKAALLNQYYQETFQGKLIMRFDDTNPAKEKVDFETVILEDLEMLQIKPDQFTHTSQYFDVMLEFCEKLMKDGKAYVDDTAPELMKEEREQRKKSKNWNNSLDENMRLWGEMKNGTENGQKCCVRAKIDMNSPNGCLRDPTIYRCKNEPHPRTGTQYKVYPTYDFACPIVDSIEGVTHCLRTTEYLDRDDQFYWFIDNLNLRKPYIWSYSRLCMMNTVLSKRKLTWFVDEGIVGNWNDPRFPTVRGVLRRGMTVEALKQFIIAQGSSRSVVMMEWDKIWAINKKVIDPIAPRYTAVEHLGVVKVLVSNTVEKELTVPKHPKNASVGNKSVWTGPKILIDAADAELLKEGENTTFINWGNLLIKKIIRNDDGKIVSVEAEPNLSNTDFKKTVKLTWLAETKKAPFTPCKCVYFDNLISKAVLAKDEDFKKYTGHKTMEEVWLHGDPELMNVKEGDIIQLQRKGFFRVEEAFRPRSRYSSCGGEVVLFSIPDGHTKATSTAGLAKQPSPVNETGSKSDASNTATNSAGTDLNNKIVQQGDKVRVLKEQKAAKDVVTAEVKLLLALKAEYKAATGSDWKPGAVAEVKPASATGNSAVELNNKIAQQGDKVRILKEQKAAKDVVTAEVKTLLALKADYKTATGSDWKPGAVSSAPATGCSTNELNNKIIQQGDKVRLVKEQKAAKEIITAEVQSLLALKAEYKSATGIDWKPTVQAAAKPVQKVEITVGVNSNARDALLNKIADQGNRVRQVKADKAAKNIVDTEVQSLLALKAEFKATTGEEWKPNLQPTQASNERKGSDMSPEEQSLRIMDQGDKVRQLKAASASKADIDLAVKTLLAFKSEYKISTGHEWKPPANMTTPPKGNVTSTQEISSPPSGNGDNEKAMLELRITDQGTRVRDLKNNKAAKNVVDENVKQLLDLKAQYVSEFGVEYAAPGARAPKKKESKEKVAPAKKAPIVEKADLDGSSGGLKKQTRLGMEATKEENLPDWYSQVITKGELIEYYDVSGCYILRPWSFSIWESIQSFVDAEIKKLGVQNCYFPLFVSKAALEKEKTHIADFAPEVAWVTKSGESDLAEHIAVRPTSETGMYPAYAKWVQSYRDLPIKLNQWNNVVRWEFKHPQPFLRTREFLWQEGHSAFATAKEAEEEVLTILDIYARVYTDLLAIPVVKGRKTEKEKFAGGDFTTTVEAFVAASGRAIQGATSHHLGQNFAKMFEIVFADPETQEKQYVYQNSWGITTRTIGVMVMIHADNRGLVLPPRVACVQVVIVQCGVTASLSESDKQSLLASCEQLEAELRAAGVRVRGDYRDNYSPGWKFNHWELKGVPIRVELGPKDLKQGQLVAVRRDTGEKLTVRRNEATTSLVSLLETIHRSMFDKANRELGEHTVICKEWSQFCGHLEAKKIILAPFCGDTACEDRIKQDSARDDAEVEAGAPAMGAKSLCIPFEQPAAITAQDKCIHSSCSKRPAKYTLFGRSY